ncbi:MAG: Mechanosensitive ion channel [Thermodesulfobacteriota bacterium]|nr:Mechanosensitive ion channel [Thermodesulfobacteriota bacterium]
MSVVHNKRKGNLPLTIFNLPCDGSRGPAPRRGLPCATRSTLCILASALIFLSLVACGPAGTDTGSWNDLLRRQQQELDEGSGSVDQLALNLPARLAVMKKRLYLLRSRFDKLMFYFNLTSTNPLALRDVLGVIGWFEAETERLVAPFKSSDAGLNRLMDTLSDLSLKVEQDSDTVEDLAQPATKSEAQAYRNDLASLQARIRSLKLSLTNGLKPAESFGLLLKKDQAQVQHAYNQALATHLLKRSPSYFTAAAWSEGMDGARKWTSHFSICLLEPVDLKKAAWLTFGAKAVLFSLFLSSISVVALRQLRKRFEGLSSDIKCLPFCLSCSIGFGVLLAITSTGLFPSSFFFTAVTVILIFGLLSLSRELRRLFLPDAASQPHSLTPLWAAVSGTVLLEALHIPEQTFIPVWAASLLILYWYYDRTAPRRQGWPNAPRIIMVWAMPVLALLALLGWGHLSLLSGVLLLLFWLNVRLARCLSAGLARLGARWEGPKTDAGSPPVLNVRGLGLPLIFISLLLGSFAWVFTFVGGGALFLEVIRYRVGWDNFTFSLYRVVCIFSLLFAVRAGIALARSAIARLPERYRDLDPGSVQSLDSIVTYVLWSLFFLSTLGLLGISFRNLSMIAGGLSVGLGFGMQTIVNNFIGGLILLFGRSIQPGDLVEVDDTRGYVKKVTIRNTLIQTFSGATIFVPNSLLVSQKMINWSHGDHKFRQAIKVGVAYGSDVERVTELLLEAAKQSPKVLSMPPPRVRFLDFGDSTLVFSLRVWIKGWADRYADSEVRYHITRIFRENGIEISFPQLDVHLKSDHGPKITHNND